MPSARAGDVVQRIRNLTKKAPTTDDRVEINAATREVIDSTRSEAIKNGVMMRTQPAQVVAPLQTKPFHVEIDETGEASARRRARARRRRGRSASLHLTLQEAPAPPASQLRRILR